MMMSRWKWPTYIMFHPLEGFDDLRWKKEGSVRVSIVIIALFFISSVASRQLTGFAFNEEYTKYFNVVPILFSSAGLFAVWCIANWAVSTLMDGEGKFKQIWISSSYALVPYIISSLLHTILSNVMLLNEGIFLSIIDTIGLLWSVILMLSAIKTVHQYTMSKTLFTILLTIAAMVIMVFLIALLGALGQQIVTFISSLYFEIMYRFIV